MANEKRLIDANALKRKLGAVTLYVQGLRFGKTILGKILESYRSAVFEEIDNAPTVDAVEVVRCKDCKHCIYISYACGDVRCGKLHSDYIKEDGFCNYGERREGDA